jgi:hypothetical protein
MAMVPETFRLNCYVERALGNRVWKSKTATQSGAIRDANHRRSDTAKSADPGLSLFAPQIALGRRRVFRHNSFYIFQNVLFRGLTVLCGESCCHRS